MKIKEEGLEEETIFAGHVDYFGSLAEIYSAADLHLFPSEYDTFGLVQIEAASRNTPTVFAAGSVASHAAQNGVNGYMFPCEKEAFAQGIIDIFADKTRLAEVSKNAFRDLYITWDTVMDMVRAGYDELISNHRK